MFIGQIILFLFKEKKNCYFSLDGKVTDKSLFIPFYFYASLEQIVCSYCRPTTNPKSPMRPKHFLNVLYGYFIHARTFFTIGIS